MIALNLLMYGVPKGSAATAKVNKGTARIVLDQRQQQLIMGIEDGRQIPSIFYGNEFLLNILATKAHPLEQPVQHRLIFTLLIYRTLRSCTMLLDQNPS